MAEPELVSGRPWRVLKGHGSVDVAQAVFYSSEDEVVTAHEMAHAAITPWDWEERTRRAGVPMELVRALEDARANLHTPGMMSVTVEDDELLVRLARRSPQALLCIAAASCHSGRYNAVRNAIIAFAEVADADKTRILDEQHRLHQSLINPTTTFTDILHLAGHLARLPFQTESRTGPTHEGWLGGSTPVGTSTSAMWTSMEIMEPDLTVALQAARLVRRKTAVDMGAVPRFLHRATIDGRVFARRRKTPGGTILIDASGSMSLSMYHVVNFIEQVPAATIAAYCEEGHKSRLVVLARDGHMVDPDEGYSLIAPDGNGCDGPALSWLMAQPGPRMWVSDEGVCSAVSEGSEGPMLEDCYQRIADDTAALHNTRHVPVRTSDRGVVIAHSLTHAAKAVTAWSVTRRR